MTNFKITAEIYNNFSYNDIKRDLILPKFLTKKLAEEIGIHLGDGYLGIHKNGRSQKYAYSICGGYDDTAYHKQFVAPLVSSLFNLNPSFYKSKTEKSIASHYQSKGLIAYKQLLGFPLGKKLGIEIPKFVLDSDYKLDLIRGLFDTDGCLSFKKRGKTIYYYPTIDICSKSRILIEQATKLLENEEGFNLSTCLDYWSRDSRGTFCKNSRFFICGVENLYKWMKIIGTSNPTKKYKFDLWQKYGYLPRNINYDKAPDEI